MERSGMSAERDQVLLILEQRLAQVGAKLQPGEAEALIADEFVEFGASGRVWRKADILEALKQWSASELTVEDFRVTELGGACCLVTYRLARIEPESQQQKSTLRSSIWKQRGEGWQMVFHQGTPCP
jgi:hypothetical protein